MQLKSLQHQTIWHGDFYHINEDQLPNGGELNAWFKCVPREGSCKVTAWLQASLVLWMLKITVHEASYHINVKEKIRGMYHSKTKCYEDQLHSSHSPCDLLCRRRCNFLFLCVVMFRSSREEFFLDLWSVTLKHMSATQQQRSHLFEWWKTFSIFKMNIVSCVYTRCVYTLGNNLKPICNSAYSHLKCKCIVKGSLQPLRPAAENFNVIMGVFVKLER